MAPIAIQNIYDADPSARPSPPYHPSRQRACHTTGVGQNAMKSGPLLHCSSDMFLLGSPILPLEWWTGGSHTRLLERWRPLPRIDSYRPPVIRFSIFSDRVRRPTPSKRWHHRIFRPRQKATVVSGLTISAHFQPHSHRPWTSKLGHSHQTLAHPMRILTHALDPSLATFPLIHSDIYARPTFTLPGNAVHFGDIPQATLD